MRVRIGQWLILLLLVIGCGEKTVDKSESITPFNIIKEELQLLPFPNHITQAEGSIKWDGTVHLMGQHLSKSQSVQVSKRLKQLGLPPVAKTSKSVGIHLGNEITLVGTHTFETDESYSLEINNKGITINTANQIGLERSLVTICQILHQYRDNPELPYYSIDDEPTYPYRGLMIDVSRHFISPDVLRENIDAMAMAKLNVLHLHLSDDQGFRIESKLFPKLHEVGGSGQYYTQGEMMSLIIYARQKGIRIIPEFSIPGHASAWLAAYPELATKKQQYQVEKNLGIFPATIHPVQEATFIFFDRFIQEMASIFPDEYMHIGGNEVLPEGWLENTNIAQFMKDNDLKVSDQLHAYFNLKIKNILKKHNKKMMLWDDASRPELSGDGTLIQVGRQHGNLKVATKMNLDGILSSGWFLDQNIPADEMYLNDPLEDPSFAEITPDTSNWQIWELNSKLRDETINGRLYLFGKSKNLRGVLNITQRTSIFQNAKLENGLLRFTFSGPGGDVTSTFNINNAKMEGVINFPPLAIPASGKLIGSNSMKDGISLPEFRKPSVLTDNELLRIKGGSACMWTDWIANDNLTANVWPRAGAIAEKLWTNNEYTNDLNNFRKRYLNFATLLKERKITKGRKFNEFVQAHSVSGTSADLSSFLATLEKVKFFERWKDAAGHLTDSPMNQLVDNVPSESMASLQLKSIISKIDSEGMTDEIKRELTTHLNNWIPIYRKIKPQISKDDDLKNVEVLALALSDLSKIAERLVVNGNLNEKELDYYKDLKSNSLRKIDNVQLAVAPQLVEIIDKFLLSL